MRLFGSTPPPPLQRPKEGYRELRGHNVATVHVVGGAHLSKESADQAARFIREARPHAVLLELCDGMVKARYIARG